MNNINQEFTQKWNDNDIINIMNQISNRFNKNIDQDEIESIKMNTLWKCILKYDADRGTKFTSYLYQQLSYAYKNKVKKKNREYNCTRNMEKVDTNQLSYRKYYDATDGLDPSCTLLLNQRYLHNMTMKEIGKANGYSRETARRKLKKAVETCKNSCEH
jgi:RNA polymerase sigma factor (sigma-70 family)